MPAIDFGSQQAANQTRNKVERYLTAADDRREKTVRLSNSIPDRILERVKESAFESREQRAKGAGKAQLSDSEQQSLQRQHDTFNWQQHGFEAMSVKAAVQSEGVTEWMDYYEPGEGVQSAMRKVREKKSQAQTTRASQGFGGVRSDTDEQRNMGRRSRQSERARSQRVKSAKEPAILEGDTEATAFLREEQEFGGDPFDVSADLEGPTMSASGRDVDLVRERNQQRTERAQLTDSLRSAEVTTNPLVWSQNPDEYDFPGVDTPDPEMIHERRSERAREVDENELAPIADSPQQWAANPDEYDLPGIDTPQDETMDTMVDDRAQQDTLGFAADPTEARETRLDAEQNTGGLMEDTRSNPTRGVETNDLDAGEQGSLTDMDAAMAGMDEIQDDVDETMGDIDGF